MFSTPVTVELPFQQPLFPDNLFGHLVATAVPGVEEWRNGAYRCTIRLPRGPAILALTPGPDHVEARFTLSDDRDRAAAISRSRWLLDLDTDPLAVDQRLSEDPVLAKLVAQAPGRRVPRTIDAEQFAIRAVLGQQISTAAARTHAGRLVRAHGEPIDDPEGALTHLFPTPLALTQLDPEALAMPRTRKATLIGLIRALASGQVDLGPGGGADVDLDRARAQLAALPGFGPWTVESVAMRALGDPDAFLPTDLGVKVAAAALGLPVAPKALIERSQPWRPWRAYAVQHLWATGDHPVNHFPLATT